MLSNSAIFAGFVVSTRDSDNQKKVQLWPWPYSSPTPSPLWGKQGCTYTLQKFISSLLLFLPPDTVGVADLGAICGHRNIRWAFWNLRRKEPCPHRVRSLFWRWLHAKGASTACLLPSSSSHWDDQPSLFQLTLLSLIKRWCLCLFQEEVGRCQKESENVTTSRILWLPR